MAKILTLCIIYDSEMILLGMKKRGFGRDRWNGFGGKVKEGENIEDAAKRELEEETGIKVKEIRKRGTLNFSFDNETDKLEVHLFTAEKFEGIPVETDEMKPEWFKHNKIPYGEMWSDDIFWLPLILEGKNVHANFHFDSAENNKIIKYDIKKV